jgi:hypothetical protein
MKKESVGNIEKVYNECFGSNRGIPKFYTYLNFVFSGIEMGEQFTDEELNQINMYNVKVTIQTVDNNGKPIN